MCFSSSLVMILWRFYIVTEVRKISTHIEKQKLRGETALSRRNGQFLQMARGGQTQVNKKVFLQ